jgi:beta-galactosidase
MLKLAHYLTVLALLVALEAQASVKPGPARVVVNLDGRWQVEEGSMETIPAAFHHTAVVPGLLDMAKPAFTQVGKKSGLRQAFWYRRSFRGPAEVPEVALLKIHKACYGTKVWLNGVAVGEHLPCFTPGYFDLRPYLLGQGKENVLFVRVGADRDGLPKGMPTGWDFEKYLFIPGIYDSVELIYARTPWLVNLQTVPDLAARSVCVVAEVQAGGAEVQAELKAEVVEARSGKRVGATAVLVPLQPLARQTVELSVPIEGCRLWSPEDPFLYELRVTTGVDAVRTRFGMRTLQFEANGKYARLNGKRFFLRGSNVTIYRFFEDAERKDRPWRNEWVRRLHRRFKDMHWNALRYCIGFPPEAWYDIADEEGFLIQDEFPIWTLGENPEKLEAAKIIPEYTEWMRERWNHPCVVIWDAQNESDIKVSGEAIKAVRSLDLSRRPWENGWAEPQSPTDCVESHPYLFIRDWASHGKEHFRMSELAKMDGKPGLNAAQSKLKVPILINEYAWLWLSREGNPTCLTDMVYAHLLGTNSTVAQRRELSARLLAAKTEFWRAHRECAGVLHFCGLGYSRPGDRPRPEGGATSDHWLDLERLKFEPRFAKYVGDAFNPVGVMADFWEESVPASTEQPVRVYVINDLEPAWKGRVRLGLWHRGKRVAEESRACEVGSFGRVILSFKMAIPQAPGDYRLVAELDGKGKPVASLRDFKVTVKP